MIRNDLKIIATITALGFVLRFTFFLAYILPDPKRSFYTIDSYTYEFPAINLLQKRRYINDCPRPVHIPNQKCIPSEEPEIYRPPVYPIFIALHYAIFGEKRESVIATQNIIDSLKIPLIYAISRNLRFTGIYSFIPSFLYAVSPSAILFSQTFMTETLQGFLILVIIYIISSGLSIKKSALSGFLTGILSLLHPLWFFFSLILPFAIYIFSPSKKIKNLLVCGLVFLTTISPWIVRNYLIWKIIIFRPGGDVFLCEIREKMYKNQWIKLEPQKFDPDVLNRASKKFGWGIKFDGNTEYPFDLTKRTQIAQICRNDILKKIWKYPIELHIGGFIRSFIPIGIAQLYYMTTGNILPSHEEITRYIIPNILEGKIKESIEDIKEKRLNLLSEKLWLFYILSWFIRIFTFVLSLITIIKPKKITFLLIFIFFYGTFILSTFESGQSRRSYTVEPILSILCSYGLFTLMNLHQRNIFRQKEEK